MPEVCSFVLEKILIDALGVGWLANKSTGGTGPSGGKQSPEANAKRRAAMLGPNNHNYGKRPPDHVIEASRLAKLGKKQSIEERAKKSKSQSGKKHAQLDRRVHKFQHESGEVFCGLQFDFREVYNLSRPKISNLISGKRKSHAGWRYLGHSNSE